MYRLTEEGKEYLEKGLPEKQLLESLKDKRRNIIEIVLPKKQIAIGWAKKKDWVKLEYGFLELTEQGKKALAEKIDIEKALESVYKTGDCDKKELGTLIKRNLVKEVKFKAEEEKLVDKLKQIFWQRREKEPKEIAHLRPDLIISGKWKSIPFRKYDVQAPAPVIYPGKKHFVTEVLEHVRKIWIEMGFKEMTGSLVEVSFWNFDSLYQPQDHPARDMQDTFYVKPESGTLPDKGLIDRVKKTHENGWTTESTGWQYKWSTDIARKCILRTHTTPISARTLASLRLEDLPAKYFAVGRCFRNETLDWKHLCEFYQFEGIVVDENVNFKHLLGYLKRFYNKLGFPKARFRPSYFPYTEMSVEIEIFSPEKKAWLELGGAGMFRPEVVKPLLGKDIPVLAWGPGVERLIMDAYKIKDIRKLYENDLDLLRSAKLWVK